jgi:KEOPS complex subunit Cgi121
LIRKIEGTGKYIAIAGFRNAKIKDMKSLFNAVRDKAKDACVQFFDANLIAGQEHLFFAALNALRTFESKTNISNSVAVETLLFACAQRQIKKAVELIGVKPESSRVAVLVVADTRQMAKATLETMSNLISDERDDGVIELSGEKFEAIKKLFKISDLEIRAKLREKGLEKETLVELVIEHIALLTVLKT